MFQFFCPFRKNKYLKLCFWNCKPLISGQTYRASMMNPSVHSMCFRKECWEFKIRSKPSKKHLAQKLQVFYALTFLFESTLMSKTNNAEYPTPTHIQSIVIKSNISCRFSFDCNEAYSLSSDINFIVNYSYSLCIARNSTI